MESYFTIWTNQNDNHSCIDQVFLPYNFVEQNLRKDLSNKESPKFVTKEEREAVVLRRQQVEVEQTATKDDRTDRPSTSNNS
ncbi:unnamed protein product [Rotaria sp. Silwood2]|nr:unnamed protein product [Rotaria sp. Silwood2]